MRILLIAPHCPTPADMGIKTHLGFVLRSLAAEHTVEVIGFTASESEGREWRRIEQAWGFRLRELIPLRRGWALTVERVKAIVSGEPVGVAHYRGPEVDRALERALNTAPDWVIYDYYPTLSALSPQIPSLLLPVDCYSLYYRRLSQTAPTFWGRVKAGWLSRRFARWEARVYPLLTAVAPVGRVDAAELRRLAPGANIRVLPVATAPLPVATALRLARTPRSTVRVLVVGAFWMPAVASDAVEFLRRWPAGGGAEVVVWGRGATDELRAAADSAGATYVDWVEDYDEFLAAGDIYVYPQRAAAGLQTKVQQAMSAGLAVVASPEILEALEVDSDWAALGVDGAAGMVAATLDLIADRPRRQATGEAAREHIARHFAPDSVRATLTEILTTEEVTCLSAH